MALTDDQIAALETADFTARGAKALYDNARLLREREIRRIAAEGGTYREIARVSGVAFQRVAQIVTGHEAPTMDWASWENVACPRCGADVGERCRDTGSHAHQERHEADYAAFVEQHPELGH